MNHPFHAVSPHATHDWSTVAPPDHLVQLYADEEALLASLEGFVLAGLAADENVVLIATPEHLDALELRLQERGINVDAALCAYRYCALDAEETLSHFFRDGVPDEDHFELLLTEILRQAGASGRRVRAFGEMVALLNARGDTEAMLRLEKLWHRLCAERQFVLFCAYPESGFTAQSPIRQAVCDCHSHVVA
jgi:hypothetical protein